VKTQRRKEAISNGTMSDEVATYSEFARHMHMLYQNNNSYFQRRCKETSRFRCYSLSWISHRPSMTEKLFPPLWSLH
jgi:hypothetical protein